jgi:hypothetical protein
MRHNWRLWEKVPALETLAADKRLKTWTMQRVKTVTRSCYRWFSAPVVPFVRTQINVANDVEK